MTRSLNHFGFKRFCSSSEISLALATTPMQVGVIRFYTVVTSCEKRVEPPSFDVKHGSKSKQKVSMVLVATPQRSHRDLCGDHEDPSAAGAGTVLAVLGYLVTLPWPASVSAP